MASPANVLSRPRPLRAALAGAHLRWPSASLAVVILVLAERVQARLALYWALGLGVGLVLQRGRLCFAGAFRDLFLMRNGTMMRAIIVGLAIMTPVVRPDRGPRGARTELRRRRRGRARRSARPQPGCWRAAVRHRHGRSPAAASRARCIASARATGLVGLAVRDSARAEPGRALLERLVHVDDPVGADRLAADVARLWRRRRRDLGRRWRRRSSASLWWETRGADGAPPLASAGGAQSRSRRSRFGQHLRAINASVLGKGWPPLVAVAALALLNVAAFLVDTPLGVTGELAAWADRAAGLVGLAARPLIGADTLAGCNLALGSLGVINASTLLDAGLVLGALLAALAAREFKVRMPRQRRRYVQSFAGGSLMGYGAGIGIGCTIGAFFSAIPSLGLSGWVFGLALLARRGHRHADHSTHRLMTCDPSRLLSCHVTLHASRTTCVPPGRNIGQGTAMEYTWASNWTYAARSARTR